MEKISSLIGRKFDNDSFYGDNDKYIKAKKESYGDKINTNFQSKRMSKESASYKFLSLIMLDSVIRLNKRYYSQKLLKEWNMSNKRIKWRILSMMI